MTYFVARYSLVLMEPPPSQTDQNFPIKSKRFKYTLTTLASQVTVIVYVFICKNPSSILRVLSFCFVL